MTSATATAHPNIALVKYWGKRDSDLNLPATGSLSMTLDIFPTTTTVTVDDAADGDVLVFGGVMRSDGPAQRVTRFLDLVRQLAGSDRFARVETANTVPSAAGLASSASGFAALALAASAAYGLDLDVPALSRLARRGSGSASRSIIPGFAVWHAGDDDTTSFAEPLDAPDLAMVVAMVEKREKPVSSREAMRRTILTSPYYRAWVESTAETLDAAVLACADGDVDRLGRITEVNALRMHALIQSCDPPIRYLTPVSVEIFDRVAALRESGVGAWATADAGPNVVVLTRPDDVPAVTAALSGLAELAVARPGPAAALTGRAHG
ncbi:diphosphomevalonate decarboxylase [Microbacterium oleivorans]|uniref:diphosphomevalonate decarboxylase n=1 Tax=Microbacterium oleivorans TaxID=273677 RepID=A0A7D5EV81_9MICO|nr:diphosphomevalonate decarboxylase [Microbacterium oleivorans]QLD10544.1 diphosphomevalonate decarboxylase [Microbacterium oleivorans]